MTTFHATDAPSIGMILCKGKSAVIVEYALRDAAKPMGVAGHRVSPKLPDRLLAELPTSDDLTREFPLMALIKLRLEIEQQLRTLAASHGIFGRSAGIGPMLQTEGVLLDSAQAFRATLRVLNDAVHGIDVAPDAATEAVVAGSRFLDDLRRLVAR